MKRIFCLLALPCFCWPAIAQNSKPELALQIGHMARVASFASSADANLLASGGYDKTAKVWDAKTGVLRFSFPDEAPVLAVSFGTSGLLITADAQGKMSVYDPESGRLIGSRAGGKLEMTAAAIAADGKTVAFALPGGHIEIRDVATGQVKAEMDGHPTRVLALAFSPDGKKLASCSDAYQEKTEDEAIARRAGDVRLWSTDDGELLHILRGHALVVRGVAWSGDGNQLASVGESGTAVLWDAKSFKELEEYNASEGQGRATSVAFAPDNLHLAVGWRDGVKYFNLKDEYKPAWSFKSGQPIPRMAVLKSGSIVAGEESGQLQFLDGKTGTATEIRGRLAPLTVARGSADGQFIVCADSSGALNLWDAKRGALERSWQAHEGVARDIAFSPSAAVLASVGDDKKLRLWDLPLGRLQKTFADFSGLLTAVAYSPDGKTLAVGGTDAGDLEKITLINLTDGKTIKTLDEPRGTIYSLAFAPDGSLTAACGNWESRGEILIWGDDYKLRARQLLRGAHGLAVSPDGKRLVGAGAYLDEMQDYASAGDVTQLWSLRAGEVTREFTAKAMEARALTVAFGPDSKLIVDGSRDGNIRLWGGDSDAPSKTLTGHQGPVNGVCVTATGTIISAGNDGTAKLWESSSGRNLATLLTINEKDAPEKVAVGTLLSSEWLAITPEGYFDGSAGAGRYVNWRVGFDVFPVAAFETAFRHPNALGAALRGENLTELTMGAEFSQGKAIPPRVEISAPMAGQLAAEPLTVHLTATDDKELKSVQLFMNGRVVASEEVAGGSTPIQSDAKPLEIGRKGLEDGAKPLEIGRKPLEIGRKPIPSSHDLGWDFALKAPLPQADGGAGLTLKAVVTDTDGLQGSEEIRLQRKSRDGAFGTLRVLSVGVSQYQNPAYNLKYASPDANAFAALWKNQNGGLFQKVEVTSLTDAAANSKAIENAMSQIAASASPDDVVAIFLSGHGVAKGENEFFFASSDINLENLDQTAVPWKTFQTLLAASKARRVVLFLDACHSGKALGARQAGNDEMATQLAKNAGAIVFASSLGDQYSFELDGPKHGAFTQALIEGIGQGHADLDAGTGKDGVVNVEELLTFLRARVPQLTDGAQLPACPLLRDFGEPFPLARVK